MHLCAPVVGREWEAEALDRGQAKAMHESDTTPTSIEIGGLLVDKDIGIEGEGEALSERACAKWCSGACLRRQS